MKPIRAIATKVGASAKASGRRATKAWSSALPDDPDDLRMSLGEHLEELRRRLVKALWGFVLAFVVCLVFVKDYVLPFFCKPLLDVLRNYDLNTQLYSTDAADTFTLYLRVSAIAAAVIAGPWMLYQLWQFVAAGLYPSERRTVTRYIPLSIGLMMSGICFAFFLVLPWTLQFFLYFTADIKLPSSFEPSTSIEAPASVFNVPMLPADPAKPSEGQLWFNTTQQRLKFSLHDDVRILAFGPANLVAPIITIPGYVSLVLVMLLLFALSFQLPIVVMALVTLGIVDIDELKSMRKVVYFVMVIVAAVITPGDVVVATLALVVPLCLLYELGIRLSRPRLEAETKSPST
jgi:sec-independent protein translocase protein TatC